MKNYKQTNPETHKRQEKEEKNLSSAHFSLSNLKSVFEFFNNLTASQKKIFNKFLKYFNYYQKVCPSQITIANQIGVAPITVNRACSLFEERGFIKKIQRYNNSCIYILSDLLYDHDLRATLLPLFTSLKIVPLVWLLSSYNIYHKKVHEDLREKRKTWQSEYDKLTNINYLSSVSVSVSEVKINKSNYEERDSESQGVEWYRNRLKKKGVEMNRMDRHRILEDYKKGIVTRSPISEYVAAITCLPLSQYGQLKLSVYSDEILKQAVSRFKGASNLKEPFYYFMAICKAIAQKEGYLPDWKWLDEMKKLLHFDDDTPVIDPNKQTTQKRESTNQTSVAWQAKDRAQESFERLQKIYEMQFKLYSQGFAFEGLTYGELEATIAGTMPSTSCKTDAPPTPPGEREMAEIKVELDNPFYGALNVESKLHDARGTNKYSKAAYQTPNIFFGKLSEFEKNTIMAMVHKDCECRKQINYHRPLSKFI